MVRLNTWANLQSDSRIEKTKAFDETNAGLRTVIIEMIAKADLKGMNLQLEIQRNRLYHPSDDCCYSTWRCCSVFYN